jgi:hypothetical protein
MSVVEFGHFVLTIAILLVAVHGLGYLAERLKQPRIVGEILAGILLGPFVLKLLAPAAFAKLFSFAASASTVMGFLYQLGLILLMFCSGAETRRLLAKENRRNTFLLLTVSDLSRFALVLGFGSRGSDTAALTDRNIRSADFDSAHRGDCYGSLLHSSDLAHLLGSWDHEDALRKPDPRLRAAGRSCFMGRIGICYCSSHVGDTGATTRHQHCLLTCGRHSDLYVNRTVRCAKAAEATQQRKLECAL